MEQSTGYVKTRHEGKVLKLKKTLYDLKQALRAWNNRIDAYFQANDFIKCPYEHALYTNKEENRDFLLVFLYVDDLIFTENSLRMFQNFKDSMVREFKMMDIGLMSYYLGIEVKQAEGGIFMSSQEAYSKSILKKFNMKKCNPVSTPVDCDIKLSKHDEGSNVDPTYFKSLVGSLRYLTCTRPDILYGVGLVSQYMEEPKTTPLLAVKRILHYIKDTTSYRLYYSSIDDFQLMRYTYSDWEGDLDERKSTSGYVLFMENTTFS